MCLRNMKFIPHSCLITLEHVVFQTTLPNIKPKCKFKYTQEILIELK